MMIPDDPFAAVISIVTVFLCMIWAYYTGKHNQVHPSSPRRRMEKIDSGSLLDFFFIIGHLKTNKRTGWELRKIPQVESVADHMYRMSVMSLVLSSLCNSDDDTGETLDANRCVKIALVHDLAEAIVGDIVPFELSGITKEDKHKMERDAMEKMAATLKNTAVAKEIMDLYQEYEDNKTPEGRLVKDLDKLEMIIQAFEYEQDHGFDLNKRDLSDFYLSAKKIRHPIAVGIAREVAHRRAVALASVSANE